MFPFHLQIQRKTLKQQMCFVMMHKGIVLAIQKESITVGEGKSMNMMKPAIEFLKAYARSSTKRIFATARKHASIMDMNMTINIIKYGII